MHLDEWAKISSVVSALALIISVIYASIQLRRNTRAVVASAFQQVINSFAQISFDIAKDKHLTALYVRASRDFAALNDVERAQYSLLMLSFMRRAESVFFQTELHLLDDEHWFGIRDSINAILGPAGARTCWAEIKNRLNPKFFAFIDALIADETFALAAAPTERSGRTHVT